MESLTDIAPPYQRQDLPLDLQSSQHLLRRRLLRFYALIPTPFYPPPNFLQYPLRRTQESRAASPLPPPSPWEKPHGPIPRPCPLPRPEHPLNRLAADPPPLSPASIAPLAAAPIASAISWPSEPLPPACKAGKTLLPDAFKLSSMAVPYLLSFGWGKNMSHRKWYKSAILCVLYIFVQRCANFSHASSTNHRMRYSPY